MPPRPGTVVTGTALLLAAAAVLLFGWIIDPDSV